MLCRALIAVLAVTYLICVMVLSGMQKEDLDAGVLTKLQRHNVNIDDMNNEELLQMCTNEQDNKKNYNVITITESQTHVDKMENIVPDFKTNSSSENFKRLRITDNNSYYFNTEHKSRHELQENDNKLNFDKIIQDNDRQAKVESILKYWQNIRKNKAAKRPDNTKESENKKSITERLHSTEEDTLNKLLTNFILRQRNASTVLTTSTQKSININDLSEKVYLLQMQDMEKNYNSNAGFGRSYAYSPIQENVRKTPKEKEIEEESGPMGENSHINRKNLTDILSLLNPDADMIRNERTEKRLKWSSNPNLNNFERFETVNTTKPTSEEPQYEIPRNMIKEIADSVKEIVLRDLHNKLHKTTHSVFSSISSSTTTIKSTATIESSTKRESLSQITYKEENTKTQESVMKKFLELFEEIKSLRQNIIVPTSDNEKDINSKEIRPKKLKVIPQVTTPPRISNELIQPRLHFYANQANRINQYPSANIGNNLNITPQLFTQKSNRNIKENPNKRNKSKLPITVQTNNIEIPPLGIPLDKPQNLISQNIVITTKVPYRIVDINNAIKNKNRHRGNQFSYGNKHLKEYNSKQVNLRLTNEPQTSPSHNFRSSNKDNVIRLRLNDNKQSNYNADYYEKINIGKYYPNLNNPEIKHQEIPRFHEKLEKVERYLDYPEEEKYVDLPERYKDNPDQIRSADENDCCNKKFRHSQAMVDCCNRKIAFRQLMSINNMKKKSYDDTHFKKILQSQQKVTDMLEKILGDKENVHSVETA